MAISESDVSLKALMEGKWSLQRVRKACPTEELHTKQGLNNGILYQRRFECEQVGKSVQAEIESVQAYLKR
jgi:hypothetical protein